MKPSTRRSTLMGVTFFVYCAVHPIHCFVPSIPCSRTSPVMVSSTPKKTSTWRRAREQPSGEEDEGNFSRIQPPRLQSRRSAIQGMLATAACLPLPVLAAQPEIDNAGELFAPKGEMLSGGSDATRGISVKGRVQQRLKPGQTLQNVYETRFIAYLARFLLAYDQAAHAWWLKQGFADSWDQPTSSIEADKAAVQARFAQFAESVEVGLADYFQGPYGSYASVPAAQAGINAAAPQTSTRPKDQNFFDKFWTKMTPPKKGASDDRVSLAKQGVLNLYALLKARYTSIAAKRQMAILFSMMSSPDLQPVAEIQSLLGEADNATITGLEIERPAADTNEISSRTSCRRGGGYSVHSPPIVTIEPPPALGDEYKQAEAQAIMRPTSRVLRINVLDGGSGYTSAPAVTIVHRGLVRKQCEASAILDRHGHVDSVLVLQPGFGYGGRDESPPLVKIDRPDQGKRSGKDLSYRTAKAVAELEYEIADIQLISGGSGYAATERPAISVSPPAEDPDWYVSSGDRFLKQPPLSFNAEFVQASVAGMRYGNGIAATESFPTDLDAGIIEIIQREPLGLIPASVRPERLEVGWSGDSSTYWIPSLPPVPPHVKLPSQQYRAFDPIFGGVGAVPVTKTARSLNAGEYARLALSGAVCTVAVRTLLNPLELVKTKIQLENDEELFHYVNQKVSEKNSREAPAKGKCRSKPYLQFERSTPKTTKIATASNTTSLALGTSEGATATALRYEDEAEVVSSKDQESEASIGTIDMIKGIVDLRGPLALFQSADITFLASLVFGSLGFGATELFRRSFTSFFFSEEGGEGGSEVILLFAAALATIVTSLVASPFETLRVRSMAEVDQKGWTEVLQDFLNETRSSTETRMATDQSPKTGDAVLGNGGEMALMGIQTSDLAPLFSRFPPIAARELPFAIAKFLAFDLIAKAIVTVLNSQSADGALPVQVGVGTIGLVVSAVAGALAGIAGALVSHPADLILTLTSAKAKQATTDPESKESDENDETPENPDAEWLVVVKELLKKDGGIANLFVGLPARSSFFFLVIGLQFFLYDYVKNLFQVSSDDLSLVLDVFYAVRQGLPGVHL